MASPDKAAAERRARAEGWDAAWIRDDQDVRATLDGCWFDDGAAGAVVDFFGLLRHSKGEKWAGQVFALLPWEEDALRRLFGWKRPDGTRRFRRGGIWVPKKNGKSTIAAGIELYMLVGDDEPGAEVYTSANDKGQAGLIYAEAAMMVRQSPPLRKRLQLVDSRKTIAYPGQGGTLQALSRDVPTKEGINAHAVIHDELHAQRGRALWDTLAYAGSARTQPLNISISTAGVYDPASIGWEQYEYAKGVLDGTIEDWAFFALVYEADKKDDWTAEATWRKANPSFGVTIDPATFAEECAEARRNTAKENNFRRYRLNQWVNQATRWIPQEAWAACAGHPIDEAELRGAVCDIGLDLGSVSDISAEALLFQCPHDPDALDVVVRFWVPEAALADERSEDGGRRSPNRNAKLYQQWVRSGHLRPTPGNATDYDFVEAQIKEDAETFSVRSLGMDRLFQGIQLSLHLTDVGIEVFPVGQGFAGQAAPMKEFERRWESAKIHHGDNPVLSWMAGHVQVVQDPAANKKIVKPGGKSDPRKVDGIQALVNGLDRAIRYAEDDGTPWWERGHGIASV